MGNKGMIVGSLLAWLTLCILCSIAESHNTFTTAIDGVTAQTTIETLFNFSNILYNSTDWFSALWNVLTLWFNGTIWTGNWIWFYYFVCVPISIGVMFEILVIILYGGSAVLGAFTRGVSGVFGR